MPPTQSTRLRRSFAPAPSTARAITGSPRDSEWSFAKFEPQYVSRDPTKFFRKNSETWLHGMARHGDRQQRVPFPALVPQRHDERQARERQRRRGEQLPVVAGGRI